MEESEFVILNSAALMKAYPGSRGLNRPPRVRANIAFRAHACGGLINSAFKEEKEKPLSFFESHDKLLLLFFVGFINLFFFF
jgi:hypothetical protein